MIDSMDFSFKSSKIPKQIELQLSQVITDKDNVLSDSIKHKNHYQTNENISSEMLESNKYNHDKRKQNESTITKPTVTVNAVPISFEDDDNDIIQEELYQITKIRQKQRSRDSALLRQMKNYYTFMIPLIKNKYFWIQILIILLSVLIFALSLFYCIAQLSQVELNIVILCEEEKDLIEIYNTNALRTNED